MFIIALIVLISFISFNLLVNNFFTSYRVFGNIFSIILDLLVVFALFYATIRSSDSCRVTQTAWMFITIALSIYTLVDILEFFFNITSLLPIYHMIYFIFYIFFAIGIFFFPRFSFTRTEKLNIFLDIGIIIVTVGLIFWIFLIIPAIINSYSITNDTLVAYIIGYLILFSILLRGIYSKFDDYYLPVLFLSMGILVFIITDINHIYQVVSGTYILGGSLQIGWTTSLIFVGLGAFLQATDEKLDLKRLSVLKDWIQKSDLIHYISFFWVLIAFIIRYMSTIINMYHITSLLN